MIRRGYKRDRLPVYLYLHASAAHGTANLISRLLETEQLDARVLAVRELDLRRFAHHEIDGSKRRVLETGGRARDLVKE